MVGHVDGAVGADGHRRRPIEPGDHRRRGCRRASPAASGPAATGHGPLATSTTYKLPSAPNARSVMVLNPETVDLRRLSRHDAIHVGSARGERRARELTDVVGAVGSDHDTGGHRVGRRGWTRREDRPAFRSRRWPPRRAGYWLPASVTTQPAGTASEPNGIGVDDPAGGVVRHLVREQIGLDLPLAARRHAHQRAQCVACLTQGGAVRRTAAQSERHAASAASEERDVLGAGRLGATGRRRRWQARRPRATARPSRVERWRRCRRHTLSPLFPSCRTARHRRGRLRRRRAHPRDRTPAHAGCRDLASPLWAARVPPPSGMPMPTPLPFRPATYRCVVRSHVLRSPLSDRPGRVAKCDLPGRPQSRPWAFQTL